LEQNLKEICRDSINITYMCGASVAVEGAVINPYGGTAVSINRSALEVACPPPGIGAEKSGNFSEFLS
jgi:hypothetical protein